MPVKNRDKRSGDSASFILNHVICLSQFNSFPKCCVLTFFSTAEAVIPEQAQENQNEKQNFTIVHMTQKSVCHSYTSFTSNFSYS
jgi:hypothetical protein